LGSPGVLIPGPEGPKKGLLYQIFRYFPVTGKAKGKAEDSIHVRQRLGMEISYHVL